MKKSVSLLGCCGGMLLCASMGYGDWVWDNGSKTLTDGNWVLKGTIKGTEISVTGKNSVEDPTTLDLRQAVTDGGSTVYSIVSVGGFKNTANLVHVRVPDTLKTIGGDAFRECLSLSTVSPFFPSTVTSVGQSSFYGCTNLVGNVVIDNTEPVSLVNNNNQGWAGIFRETRITSATLTAPITSIPSYAFYGCKELKWVILPDVLESISSNAFRENIALESITPFFPSSVKSIGPSAFYGCTNLVGDLVLDNTEPVSLSRNNNEGWAGIFTNTRITSATLTAPITTLTDTIFQGCKQLEFVVLPETLTTISANAFKSCTALVRVTPLLPKSITSVGASAFCDCTSLTGDLVIEGTNVVSYSHNGNSTGIFENTKLTSVKIVAPTTQLCGRMFYNCKQLGEATLPEEFGKFNWSGDFGNCTALTNVFFSGNCPTNFNNAFSGLRDYQTRVFAPRGVEEWVTFQDASVEPMTDALVTRFQEAYPQDALPKGTIKIANNNHLWFMFWTPPKSQLRTTVIMVR